MKAMLGEDVLGSAASNDTQGPSKDASKRELTTGQSLVAVLFARLRRLEQRIDKIETKVSTNTRDIWRIEKKQQNQAHLELPVKADNSLGLPASFFGGD
jgi:hypothetical protein